MNPWIELVLIGFVCYVLVLVLPPIMELLGSAFMTILRRPPHLNRRRSRAQARAWARLRLQEPNLRIRVNGQVVYLPHLELLKLCATRAPKGIGWSVLSIMPNGKDKTPPQFKMECTHGTTYHYPIELEMKSE